MGSDVKKEVVAEQKKIKPFCVDTYSHGLSIDESNAIVYKIIASNKAMYEVETHSDFDEGLENYPYLCVEGKDSLDTITIQSCSQLKGKGYFTEISPEDVDTWLSHGLTLEEYKNQSMVMLDKMQGKPIHTTEDFNKPLLTIAAHPLRSRKDWIIQRQYAIVRALNLQADKLEELNEGWIMELADLIGEE